MYRRVLLNDIVARPEDCAALVRADEARAVCVANTFRCKLPHKKAFFAVLTDPDHAALFSEAERADGPAHVPWTGSLPTSDERAGARAPLLKRPGASATSSCSSPTTNTAARECSSGGKPSEAEWDDALQTALRDPHGSWIVQERIPVRREVFPEFDAHGAVTMRDMLVDLAPYLFRGRIGGYLTRLSATGLANVTSGGGQVPPFVIS